MAAWGILFRWEEGALMFLVCSQSKRRNKGDCQQARLRVITVIAIAYLSVRGSRAVD